jgi:hypothetical protein
MAFPRTRHELEQAGYRYVRTLTCTGPTCSAMIEWWLTPKKKYIPLEFRESFGVDICEPHWATCPDRARFQSSKRAQTSAGGREPRK